MSVLSTDPVFDKGSLDVRKGCQDTVERIQDCVVISFRRPYRRNSLVNAALLLLSLVKMQGAVPLNAPPFPPLPAMLLVSGSLGGSSELFGFSPGG